MPQVRFNRSVGFCALAVALAFACSPAMAIVSTFNGGDPGEGLDLQGNFRYAVNTLGPGGLQIGDALFTNDASTPGYTQNAPQQILNWSNPNYGASTNDNNLEIVMQSIRHGAPGGQNLVNLANLIPGKDYKLQLLFTEACCNRVMDVHVNGDKIADDFNIQQTIGGINGSPTVGAVVTHSFTAFASTAQIRLDGPGAAGPGVDTNPVLNGLTLEDLSSSFSFAGNVALGKPVTATSTYPNALFIPGRVVDASVGDAQGTQWLAADGVTNASLTIDLQGVFNVTAFELLNTANGPYLDRATGMFSIDVAGADGVFKNVLTPRTLQGFAAGFQTELVNLEKVSFVRFNMLSIVDPDNGGPFPLAGGGLNELRVIGTFAIPEPATASLALLGLAGLCRRRRAA